jgi:hypothetical protein
VANALTVNPLKIDTSGAGLLLASNLYVKSIRWVGATTAGHLASVTDKNDVVVWSSVAAIATNNSEAEQIDANKPWKGLKVPTLQSGVLYITLKHNPPAS